MTCNGIDIPPHPHFHTRDGTWMAALLAASRTASARGCRVLPSTAAASLSNSDSSWPSAVFDPTNLILPYTTTVTCGKECNLHVLTARCGAHAKARRLLMGSVSVAEKRKQQSSAWTVKHSSDEALLAGCIYRRTQT